ncbi:cadherin-like protein 26 [Genypterus blacodes]|uniref:cadherin-like protein 26 n=1 Tax=Genypterus blacodes TaxID=154954 RepID=UPI003F771315
MFGFFFIIFVLLGHSLSRVTCSDMLSRHRRSWIIDSLSIEEEHPGPFPYELGKIDVVREYRIHFDLYGEGVDEEPKGVLSIDKDTGIVYVHKAVDYEDKSKLKLRFEAKRGDLSLDTKLGVEITIQDINDNPPRFQRKLYEISVEEETTQGSQLLTMDAYDRDQRGTPNSTFHYEIKSVSPKPSHADFFINDLGVISFKGCLDYEEAKQFTVLVEAKDHGDVVSLSSSTIVLIHIQDGNNNLPIISGQTGNGKVKEGETGSSPLQLHATDRDSKNSLAWKAKYTIHGDEGGHFKIETQPQTNDGILTIVKPLDFEEGEQTELTISVENETPFFSCEVQERTSSGLWKVNTAHSIGLGQPHSVKVLIHVEDINDPPVFTVSSIEVVLAENTPTGTWVEKVTATDHDSMHARDFVYTVGSDPGGWVKVDPHTGDITTVKIPDRESPLVVDGIYTIILHAVDKGDPPLTGLVTLLIHVTNKNDNVPQLMTDRVDMCVSDDPTTANITAFDLDDSPFGGPFQFQLLGDVKGKWRLAPSYGFTVGLVREPGVYSGPHTVDVRISDLQGQFATHTLSVTVCDCSVTPNCQSSRHIVTKVGSGALGIVFVSLLLVLLALLMAIIVSCKKEFTTLQTDEVYGETLLASNIEKPGTDCETLQYATGNGYHHNQVVDGSSMYSLHRKSSSLVSDVMLLALLDRRLSSVEAKAEDLGDYRPHRYADEGDSDHLSELDHISIPDDQLDPRELMNLGPRFKELASICKPPHI